MSYPTWEQIFNKPSMSTCAVECPPAWCDGSMAVSIADREIMRLGENCCMYNPPITEEEIEKYARHFRMTKREAELKIREGREAHDGRNQKAAA